MADDNLCFLSIREVADLMRTKQVSPVEVTRAVLRRIERLEPKLNSFVSVTAELALEQAARAEKEISGGNYRGPLHGVPFSLKDIIDVAGLPTTCASKVMADHYAQENSSVVDRLYGAGAVLIGKNNLQEFACGATNDCSYFGPAHNPWDLDRVTGGSSGGSAAAVAAGLTFGALGTDTGGSIRIPASACGVVGLKPQFGRVSVSGVYPFAWSMDHVGPLARTVEDAAILLNAISGYDLRDPGSVDRPVPDFTTGLEDGVKGLSVGVPREFFFEKLDDEVEAAVRLAIAELEDLGARIEEVSLPSIYQAHPISSIIMTAEGAVTHEELLRTRGQDYSDFVRGAISGGFSYLAVDLLKAQKTRALITKEFEAAFQQVDLIVTPTLPVLPTKIGQAMMMFGGEEVTVRSVLTRFTRPANVTLMPAISIPCGFASSGLPVGLQIHGRLFDESTVLRAAHAYEAATEWHLRRPQL